MADDLNAAVSRIRLALIQSRFVASLSLFLTSTQRPQPDSHRPSVREKSGYFETPPHRRRRSSVTAVTYAGTNKDGAPVFTKQKVTKVV